VSVKIAIIGAGAMGSLFASCLSSTVAEVWAFDIWKEHVDAIRRDGLIVHRDGKMRILRLRATSSAEEAGVCDIAMVFVKFGQTAAAIAAARPMIGPDTMIVTLQNGIGNVEIIAALCPDSAIAFGLTTLTCELLRAGHIEESYRGEGETSLWPRNGAGTEKLQVLCAFLRSGGINAALEPDIGLKIWKKLVVNCCLNTMCAITGQKVGAIADSPAALTFLDGVADEIAAAASLEGVPLSAGEARTFLRSVAHEARNHEPSMLIDVRNRRRTEIDCLNGAVLAVCEKHGLAAPHNSGLYAMIRLIEQGFTGAGV
jgi:2-dehydropantoate 2-reductase